MTLSAVVVTLHTLQAARVPAVSLCMLCKCHCNIGTRVQWLLVPKWDF